MGEGSMINRIRLASNEYANPDGTVRRVDQIEIHIMDMWMRKDITCERDEYLARKLAYDAGVELENVLDGANAPPPLTPEEKAEFAESLRVFAEMVPEDPYNSQGD